MFTDRHQPLSLRGIDRLNERSQHDSMPAVAGMSVDTSSGNPIYTADRTRPRYVTARIIDIAYQSDGTTPLLDYAGNYQYQWIEEQRYIDGTGFPAWQDATAAGMDDWRGSVDLGGGQYLHLAHEANGYTAEADDHVIMWAGVLDLSHVGRVDWEHVFYQHPTTPYALAQADWELNGGAWRVSVKRCDNYKGDNPAGDAFWVYFFKRRGNYCPAIFGPPTTGGGIGDVISYVWDYSAAEFVCTSSDSYDCGLNTILDFDGLVADLAAGWKICDGVNPVDSKIASVPDIRGRFRRGLDPDLGLWTNGDKLGQADDGKGGFVVGISSTRLTTVDPVLGIHTLVTSLEDSAAWGGAAHLHANDVTVLPPAYTACAIIRYK